MASKATSSEMTPFTMEPRSLSHLAGDGSSSAEARRAIRSCPMVEAARSPWPATSPMAKPTFPLGSCTTSYQSPPTSMSALAGT
jgi:hypothetical protein